MKKMNAFSLILGMLIGTALAFSIKPHDKLLSMRHNLERSVFKVHNLIDDGFGSGFAIFIGKQKYMITNAHVCVTPPYSMRAVNQLSGTEYVLTPKFVDPNRDVCISEIVHPEGISTIPLALKEPELGETIYTLGHPHAEALRIGEGQLDYKQSVDIRMLDNFCGGFMFVPCYASIKSFVLSMVVIPGQSGSPLLNSDGEVIGIVYATDSTSRTGFAVTLDALKSAISDLTNQLKSSNNPA